MKVKSLLIAILLLSVPIAGCGSSSIAQNSQTTQTKESRIKKFQKGEEFPIFNDDGQQDYVATVTEIVSPYELPYQTATERALAGIIIEPKPGYKYVKISLKISNPSKYPVSSSPDEFMLFDERDKGAVRAGSISDSKFWPGGDILPNQTINVDLIYQIPDAAAPVVLQAQFLGRDTGQKISEVNL